MDLLKCSLRINKCPHPTFSSTARAFTHNMGDSGSSPLSLRELKLVYLYMPVHILCLLCRQKDLWALAGRLPCVLKHNLLVNLLGSSQESRCKSVFLFTIDKIQGYALSLLLGYLSGGCMKQTRSECCTYPCFCLKKGAVAFSVSTIFLSSGQHQFLFLK